MKRIVSVVACFIASMLLMSSCGEIISTAELERETEEERDRDKASDGDEGTEKLSPIEISPIEPDTVETVPAETTAPPARQNEYEPGILTANGTYVSEWMGLRFTPGASIVMSTAEELAAMTDPSSSFIYEMMAADSFTGNNVNIIVEKLSLSAITEEQYLAFGKLQYQNLGLELKDMQEYDVDFLGKKHRVLEYNIEYEGVTATNVQLVRKIGNRMVVITLCSFDGDIEKLISCFSEY